MTDKETIHTNAAPAAIGPYSQAVKTGSLVFLSGQIPLVPETMEIREGGIDAQTHQVFKNLSAVAEASNSSLNDAVKLTIYLVDLADFAVVNGIMAEYFSEPYPARATVQVSALPKDVSVEVDAVLAL
ncbi:MAG: RidA family protein [Gammaproteobacteria bacterium]|jgi:reactive intermediate/imine deaminase|nr:RidA family protein [Gammaproteobacteria bacterium]MBT3860936.1 RidA family protein [Gammaproteobacteria bacterium]MBT3988459.1 RidA family protein [Gammaproteobacteria bacterium]MBT4256204.1 RidA family protein [Gammaproteobacteria bacterium]MBT4581309.1 RidA family protein [Gammaproteobacteria bacterium]